MMEPKSRPRKRVKKTETEEAQEMVSEVVTQFRAARRVSTPIVAINTPDPSATVAGLVEAFTESNKGIPARAAQRKKDDEPVEVPISAIRWDVIRGLVAVNEASVAIMTALCKGGEAGDFGGPQGLVDVLDRSLSVKVDGLVLFVYNAHRLFTDLDPGIPQAVWNVRDCYKTVGATVVLLSPDIDLPNELRGDVLVLEEALPDAEALGKIVAEMHDAAGLDAPDDVTMTKVTDAVVGLPAYPAETAIALSLSKKGIDIDGLWGRKRQMINETDGLSVYDTGALDPVKGYDNVQLFLARLFKESAKDKANAIVFIDEIEKSLAGSSGGNRDSSGVSADQLGEILKWMEDSGAEGMIFVGPPGSGKSAVAKAAGALGGVPTIAMDLGGMKGKYVGQSEGMIRAALRVVKAISSGKVLVIATCNNIAVLPPELRRRFAFGTFYFDTPSHDEQVPIWELYRAKYEISESDSGIADDTDWTGAEIKKCCVIAYKLGCSLQDASDYIVPVARAAPEIVAALREQADGRYISASYSGVYKRQATATEAPQRRIEFR